ncbi:MAG: hypothetical protein V4515_12585 [Chloroflexota bacterium]
MTPDLIDYLRDKLVECRCPYGYSMGRTTIGRIDLKRWQPGCPVHPTDDVLEAENQRRIEWLMDLPEPEPTKRKRWWRR